jgi:alkylation response protein AidB-like acyl-CoA dehydrogenase
MDLSLTDEQLELRTTARSFLAASTAGVGDDLLDGRLGWDPAIWPRLAELGWLGISVPEEGGGVGLGLFEETVVVEEAGAALLSAPLLSTLGLLAPVLTAGGDNADLLSALVAGETRGSLAWMEPDSPAGPPLAPGQNGTFATAGGAGWSVSGRKRWVPDAERSDLIAVVANSADGLVLVGVEPGAPGVTITGCRSGDPTRPLADLELAGAPARILVAAGDAERALATAWRRFLVLAAADAVGIIQRALDLSTAYAGERKQFGKPIGSYQAVSHQLADTYVALELSRSLVLWAALVEGDPERELAAASAAAAKAIPAAVAACETAIQVHGGIGTTWESPLHRYLKRAFGLVALVGPASRCRAAAARSALGGEG